MKTKVLILALVSVLLYSCSNDDSILASSEIEVETVLELEQNTIRMIDNKSSYNYNSFKNEHDVNSFSFNSYMEIVSEESISKANFRNFDNSRKYIEGMNKIITKSRRVK